MAKILITGGTGYIGRFLAKYLYDQGHEVWVALHDQSRQVLLPHEVISTTLIEAQKEHDWEAIVHLAYGFRRGWSRTIQLNLDLAQKVIEMAFQSKARLIFASSISVFGYCPKYVSRPLSELRHLCREDVYTYVKGYLDKFILSYAKRRNLPVHVIRIGNVMGPGSIWTSLLLSHFFDVKLDIDLDAFSNATSIFNLVDLISTKLLATTDSSSIDLSTEFSMVTWGEWLRLLIGEETFNEIAELGPYAMPKNQFTNQIQAYVLRLIKTSRTLRRISDILPEYWYQRLKQYFSGPRLEFFQYFDSIDEVQRKVFGCKHALPSHGSHKYSLEETCERIREWAKEGGYLL